MDTAELSDRGLNYSGHQTPEDPGSGKFVHYYGGSDPDRFYYKTDALLLLLRLVTFAFSLASVVLMATDNHSVRPARGRRIRWFDFDAYRYVLAASAIVCVYSVAELGLGLWYLFVGTSLMPDSLAHWFDYGHDQGFAYLIFSACSAGTVVAHSLRDGQIRIHSSYACEDVPAFCTQAEIAIAMGFAAFLFIAVSSLLTGLRLVKWLLRP